MRNNDVNSSVNVWQTLETSRGLTAVAASWRERLGDEFDGFKDAFLQRAAGVAKGMPCPRGCGCTHEIVTCDGRAGDFRVASDEGVAIPYRREHLAGERGGPPHPGPFPEEREKTCKSRVHGFKEGEQTIRSPLRALCRCEPPTCPDIPLAPDDVVLLELSWTKLARALCHVFALDYKPADLGLLNTRQIGSWSAEAVPVILTIQHERGWFRSVLLELLARLRQRFIVLAPTAKNMDAVSRELLASSDAAFFSLDATVTLTAEGTLRLRGAEPGKLFAKFALQPSDADEEIASRAFALVHQLDAQGTRKPPSLMTVFRMYCIDGFSASTIARKCGSNRMTIRSRLKLVETKTGMNIDQLRKVSAHLERAEASFADSRASHIHRKNLIYDEDDSNER